jgi:conjugative transposon TraM protein
MFWAFGGGKTSNTATNSEAHPGLNMELPDPKFKDDKELNKLSFYNQATLDSAKAKAAEKLDPYWNKFSYDSSERYNGYNDMDANRMKVYNKLDELKMVLTNAQKSSRHNPEPAGENYSLKPYSSAGDIDRLREMMQRMKSDSEEDPEIGQLNEMLDKIHAIQNPDKIEYAAAGQNVKNLKVQRNKYAADISLLKSKGDDTSLHDTVIPVAYHNAFYSITNDNNTEASNDSDAIECIIPETQTIVAGATVKLALSNNVSVNNQELPSGTLIYGTASVSNERLKIAINSIRHENSILPVSLNVYDMDGQEGIYIPGSISRTVAKESANSAIGNMGITTVDPSIGAQAASAGIEAAKTLFSKKVKLIRMSVRAGYKVLLKGNNAN